MSDVFRDDEEEHRAPCDRNDQPAIDFLHLRKFTLGARDLECEVLRLFVGQSPLYLSQLLVADTASAWKEASHSLKGSAMAIGAHRVADLAAAAEKSGRWRDDSARGAIVAELREALAQVEDAVAEFESGGNEDAARLGAA